MRLFVALELQPALRRGLQELLTALRRELPEARWVAPEKVHLTLCFLGETEPDRVADLRRALEPAFAACPALRLPVTGPGVFPNRRAARILWLGLEGDEELLALQKRVVQACSRSVGLEPERRPFRPHLTVARCRRPWRSPQVTRYLSLARLEGELEVDRGSLIESVLEASGAVYRSLDAFPMTAGAPSAPDGVRSEASP